MKALVEKVIEYRNFPLENITEMVEVKVGDYVGFKSDHEQHGQIVEIKYGGWNNSAVLVLENKNGFGGDYLRYATLTEQFASDCWVE